MVSDVEWSSVSEDQWDVQIRVPMGFVTTMYWKSMALTLVEVVQEVVSCGVEGHVVWSCVVTPGMHSTVTPRLQDEMQVFHFRWTRRDVWK